VENTIILAWFCGWTLGDEKKLTFEGIKYPVKDGDGSVSRSKNGAMTPVTRPLFIFASIKLLVNLRVWSISWRQDGVLSSVHGAWIFRTPTIPVGLRDSFVLGRSSSVMSSVSQS
ncbi:hypothetical protein HAX54_052292, partial [Datura stramonium]|nr:hypothetical protein [Datura stramonium]